MCMLQQYNILRAHTYRNIFLIALQSVYARYVVYISYVICSSFFSFFFSFFSAITMGHSAHRYDRTFICSFIMLSFQNFIVVVNIIIVVIFSSLVLYLIRLLNVFSWEEPRILQFIFSNFVGRTRHTRTQ